MMPPNGRGGVLEGASIEPIGVCSKLRCLFWVLLEGGGGGGVGVLTMALRWLLLCSWPGTGHKTANYHCPLCHHVFTLIGFNIRANMFDCFFLGFLNGCFRFDGFLGFDRGLKLNEGFRLHKHMCLFMAALRHAFS